MARRLLLLVVLAFGAVALGACGGGGKSSTPPCPPKADTRAAVNGAVTVCGFDIRFDVKKITTTAGMLTVTFINKGAIQHTFTVEKTDLDLVVGGGSSKTGSVALQKGTYIFKCTVSGHEAAGMKGTIEVS
jgi:plastocyanin